MKDAAEKRAMDSKAVADKKGAKADTEAALEQHTDDKKSASKELAATLQAIQALGGECDWLLKYFDVRKEARASEIDALGKAKAVLSGADLSLVQTSSKKSLRGAPKMEIVGKPTGYRNAWDDCGGAGASATMRMQTIAAKIKGWSKPRKFIRNAAQDAGAVHPSGTKPGPAAALVYPAAGTWTAAREGLAKASDTLAKYKFVQWKPEPDSPFKLFEHPQGSGLVTPCPKTSQHLPESCSAQFGNKPDGEQCPQLDCPKALGISFKLVCGGGCCPVCWAPDHILKLDRHTAEDTGLVVPTAPQAPSSCGGVNCFKPICAAGTQKGFVSGSCCYSCVAR